MYGLAIEPCHRAPRSPRPNNYIYCFTDNPMVQRRLALYHGVRAKTIVIEDDADRVIDAALAKLVEGGHVKPGTQASGAMRCD